jgi:hypothetical protein
VLLVVGCWLLVVGCCYCCKLILINLQIKKVNHTDGSMSTYSTRERPKLFLDPVTSYPLALFNGVAGVPGGDKDICGEDWSFTLVQPIRS